MHPIEYAYNRAVQHYQAGQFAEAERIYREILRQEPDQPETLYQLATIASRTKRVQDAIALLRRAVTHRPHFPEAFNDLGNAFADTGHTQDAIAAYQQALVLRPDYAEALNNLGSVLQANGQVHEAIACYRRAAALASNLPQIHNNLGFALLEAGQVDAAIAACERAIALNPSLPEAHNNLGNALQRAGQLDNSIASFRRATALRPQYAQAWCNLGSALHDRAALDEAIAACRRSLELEPNLSAAHSNLGNVLKDSGRIEEAMAHYRQAVELDPQSHSAESNVLYAMYFDPAGDAQTILVAHRKWASIHADPLTAAAPPHQNDRTSGRRLRIGYVSPDFREHVVGRFLLGLFDEHDHEQVEVVCFSGVSHEDELTNHLRSRADEWHATLGLSDEALAHRIREKRIDILVDLTLNVADNRLLTFARKPAPVQVTYLAYAGTSGMAAMDYRLTDALLDPPENDHDYSEQSVRLKSYWCYRPWGEQVAVGALPALRAGHVTFGCLNNFAKVSQRTLEVWADILRAIPESRLLIHAVPGSHRLRVTEPMAARGVDPERVEFIGWMRGREYFETYNRIDIALDPFPYNGGTTTCDALWMGVPVISLKGKQAVGRAGVTILNKVGTAALIAPSEARYLGLAKELADDLNRIADLRAGLRTRMSTSVLCDAKGFARDVEMHYRSMWRKWCAR